MSTSNGVGTFLYKIISFNSRRIIKKQIDVATMTLSEAKKYYDLNQVKLLVISSEERLNELPEISTWSEEGIELVVEHWRGIIGPPNMTKDEI